jgi:hypothetical protein
MELGAEVAEVSTGSRLLFPSVPTPMAAVYPVAHVEVVVEVPEADMLRWITATPARVLSKTTLTSAHRTTLTFRHRKDWTEDVAVAAVVEMGSADEEAVGAVRPRPTPSE